jgi:hypothetical protein
MNVPSELNLGALPRCHACSEKQQRSVVTRVLADLLWHIWLLYYYLSIALRENILKANGSEIHGWWFMHHYISMVSLFLPLPLISILSLTARRCHAPT